MNKLPFNHHENLQLLLYIIYKLSVSKSNSLHKTTYNDKQCCFDSQQCKTIVRKDTERKLIFI